MFGNKKLKALEERVEQVEKMHTLHNTIFKSINDVVSSLNKSQEMQRQALMSMARQIDILAEHTLLKDFKKIKEAMNEHDAAGSDAPSVEPNEESDSGRTVETP